MVIRISRFVLRLLAVVVALGTVGGVALTWLLLSGPVSVPWLTPYVEAALAGGSPRAVVEIDDTRLRLGHDQLLELSAIGVRARGLDGELLVELADVRIALSTTALLFEGIVAPELLEAEVPSLVVVRREDGSVGIGDRAPAMLEGEGGEFDLGLLLDKFLGLPDPSDPLSYVERIRVTGGTLGFEDRMVGRTFRARDAALTIEIGEDALHAALDLVLDQAAQAAAVRISAGHALAEQRITFDVDFRGLSPATFAGYAPDVPLDGLQLAIHGKVGGGVSLDGDLSPIRFDLGVEDGAIELPDTLIAALPIDRLRLRGSLAADLEAVTVEALSLETTGASLSCHGGAAWREGQHTLHADIVARNVAARELDRLWPPRFGREAREWVVENITEGIVPDAHATLRFAPGDLDQRPIPEDAVTGAFRLQDLTLRYFESMPPLTGVNGWATFTGQRMDFAVTSGQVDDLVLGDRGSVVITGIGLEGHYTTQLEVVAEVEGPVDQALSLIDRPPLGFATKVGIRPEAASGHATTALRIGTPLNREMNPADVRIQAEATITDGAIAGDPVDLSGARLTLKVDDQGADLAGEAVVEGVPLELEIHESFGDGTARRYRVVGTPEVAILARLGIDLPFTVEGEFGLDATITESPGGREVDLALDLAPTAIEVPELDWVKPLGEPGALRASVALPAEGPIQVSAFALDSAELIAEGNLEARTEPVRLERVRLDHLRLHDSEAAITFRRDETVGYDIQVEAETLDLSRWLGADSEADDEDGQPLPPFRLGLRAERVIVDDDFLTDVNADLAREDEGWRSASLVGGLASGGQVELSLVPAGDRQRLRLTSTDAGELLQDLDRSRRVEGGDLLLEATIFRQRPRLAAEGTIEASDFAILDAPTLARLLTLASLTGITDVLGGEGLHVDRLEMSFTLEDGRLSIGRSRMYGSQVGLTFEGEVDLDAETLDLEGAVVPAYGVNWAIGQIPVIGALLKGSEGEGAFAASYTLRGPFEDPAINVNPLTAITPGFIRELFSGIRAGTLEPPEKLPSEEK